MVNLRGNPFFLNDEQILWVHETLGNLSTKEKVGQLFCEVIWNCNIEEEENLFRVINPGGVMFRPNSAKKVKEAVNRIQRKSKIPLLVAANLERGGNGGADEGTYYGSPMQVAASDDDQCAEELGLICGSEGTAMGINWSFAPIIDLDYNYFSTVTNTRTFGSEPELVKRMALGYNKGMHEFPIATCIKHFPGDGIDFRDQHKVCSVNTMTVSEWDNTYGKVYRSLIEDGVESVMSAHIRCPEYSKYFNENLQDADILPASLSYDLNNKLLREKLGFNGLIVTDDTEMVGFMVSMSREKAVPACIAAGCDMFLFTVNHEEDVSFMEKGIEDGVITPERLDEAVTRILALKAKLNLQEADFESDHFEELDIIGCDEHLAMAERCAEKAVTLVKDVGELLPLTPQKYQTILLINLDHSPVGRYFKNPQYDLFKADLINKGFQVEEFNFEFMPGIGKEGASITEIKEKFDLILYFAGAKAGYRAEWKSIVCGETPSYVKEVPTMMVSFGSPYFLLDLPMVSTYINGYSESDFVRKAMISKICGEADFIGKNPVDPFCGLWDTRL